MANEKRAGLVRDKFIKRWAKRYVDIYLEHGKETAVAWGTKFFHSDDVPLIAKEAKKIIGTK